MIADALVRAKRVDAGAVVADVRVTLTLVYIHAVVPVPCQRESRVTEALEAALQIVAGAVVANPGPLVALVDVHAVSLADAQLVPSWTDALEVSLFVDALGISGAGIRYLGAIQIAKFDVQTHFKWIFELKVKLSGKKI